MANSLPITSRSSCANESKIDARPGAVGGATGKTGGGIAAVGITGGGIAGAGIAGAGSAGTGISGGGIAGIAGGGIAGAGIRGGGIAGGGIIGTPSGGRDLHSLHVHHLQGLQTPIFSPSTQLLLHTSQEPRLPRLDSHAAIVVSGCPRPQQLSPAALRGANGDEAAMTDPGVAGL